MSLAVAVEDSDKIIFPQLGDSSEDIMNIPGVESQKKKQWQGGL